MNPTNKAAIYMRELMWSIGYKRDPNQTGTSQTQRTLPEELQKLVDNIDEPLT